MLWGVDPSLLSADALARASVILAVGLLLLFSAVVSICIILNNEVLHDVIGFYLISLALADLLCALLIVPLSIYSTLSPHWNFSGDDSFICKCSSYLHIVLLSSTIYTLAWIGVDRYSAFMKPSRYECEHTMTRCKCWILFSWITAILLACPIIVAKMEVNYYPEFELLLFPSICTVAFTSFGIFAAMQKPEELEDSQRSIVETDENFVVTLFVLISFILAWLPIILVQFLPSYLIHPADWGTMKFAFMWLAIGGSSSKLLIYLFTNQEFRKSFCSICRLCRRRRMSSDGNYIDNEESSQLTPNSSGCCCCLPKLNTSPSTPNNAVVSHMPEYGSFVHTTTTATNNRAATVYY
uniref:G-protein coupled receptors family 1 profile domain-containing protein n=1 Tax=Ditylenchus dipsaci TaxID=166011 RepID=A0A915CUY8_9BILA